MTISMLQTVHILEVIGIAGFALYVTNYALLTARVLNGNCVAYFLLNLLASGCVLVGLTHSFNLASALIQAFWVAMSLIGIAMRIKPRRRAQT